MRATPSWIRRWFLKQDDTTLWFYFFMGVVSQIVAVLALINFIITGDFPS